MNTQLSSGFVFSNQEQLRCDPQLLLTRNNRKKVSAAHMDASFEELPTFSLLKDGTYHGLALLT